MVLSARFDNLREGGLAKVSPLAPPDTATSAASSPKTL
jgi:hypothetical protein